MYIPPFFAVSKPDAARFIQERGLTHVWEVALVLALYYKTEMNLTAKPRDNKQAFTYFKVQG